MQTGPREIAQRLADRAEEVCNHLLPQGKRQGNKWVAGDAYGGVGKSLIIELSGSKRGVGADFANPESFAGDLLDLWCVARGLSKRDAILEAKKYLGIEQVDTRTRKQYAKPEETKKTNLKPEAVRYLIGTRLIPEDTITAFRVRQAGEDIAFPIFAADGETLVNVKYLGLKRGPNGEKRIHASKGCAPAFFGWQTLKKYEDRDWSSPPEIIITEGEIDAMTWHAVGFPSVSVPSGSSSAGEAIEYDWDMLSTFETIYLSADQDKPGDEMVATFANRLGKARLRRVRCGEWKDANEALVKGGWKQADFARAIVEAKGLYDSKVGTYDTLRDEIIARKLRIEEVGLGLHVPILGTEINIAKGITVLVVGHSGHGKTLLMNQIATELAQLGERVAVVNLEHDAVDTAMAIMDVQTGVADYVEDVFDKFVELFGDKFVFYRETGTSRLAPIMEFFEFARSRYGATQFVLDNFTKLDIPLDDYPAQAKAMNLITDFTRDNGVTCWVLAHQVKKIEREDSDKQFADKVDVRGSGAITDLARLILHVWRNKANEGSKRDKAKADTKVFCTKQTIGGKEPTIHLQLDSSCSVVRFTKKLDLDPSKASSNKGDEEQKERSNEQTGMPYSDA